MYGQSQFCQNQISAFLPNYPPPPYGGNWHYPVVDSWSCTTHINESIDHDPLVVFEKDRGKTRKVIEKFIEECEHKIEKDVEIKKKSLKISEARNILAKAYKTIEKLEKLGSELKNNLDLSDEEWAEKHGECRKIQEEFSELHGRFISDENVLKNLENSLKHRKKKREREARKRAAWGKKKSRALELRSRRHEEIDAWIREKRDTIEREKQAEILRKDADIVLSEVRGKRSDAKKYLNLLQELQNLRRVRVQIARARGENLSLAADQAFENIVGQLIEQWTCLDREYSIEEQGLKLMLKTDNEEKIEKQKRSTFDDWEMALFGAKIQTSNSNRMDLHNFVMIRHAWDKYVNFEGDGSRIPIGWIMPVVPSSAAWQKCLKKN